MASRGVGPIAELFDAGTPAGLDDAALLGRFLADRDGAAGGRAFAALVARHGPMVRAACRGVLRDDHDAEDAAQATFLILARRAGSIRRADSAASWLFGVARRVALRSRADAARRRAREARAAVPEQVASPSGRDPDDLAALVEEIDRLPAAARAAVVLCDLEGLTYDAAARELGWPPGTLATRLRRARDRLRSRLARRGVAVADPSALLCALASPPIGPAAGAGTVSPSVALVAGRTLLMMRLKSLAIGLTMLVGVSAGVVAVGVATGQAPPVPPPGPRPAPATPRAVEAPANPSWTRTLPGGVTVELLGIGRLPTGRETEVVPAGWWDPAGGRMDVAPAPRTITAAPPKWGAQDGERQLEFFIRVGRFAQPPAFEWQIEPARPGSVSNQFNHFDRASGAPALATIVASVPDHRRAGSIRFGVAGGPWRTAATGVPQGRSVVVAGDLRALVVAREVEGRAHLAITHDTLPGAVRITVVDRQGRVCSPSQVMYKITGGWWPETVGEGEFLPMNPRNGKWETAEAGSFQAWESDYPFPLDDIAEFRIQTRPFEWTTFDEVALEPGGKPAE